MIQHTGEPDSNRVRHGLGRVEPLSQRTFTPTQVAVARAAGAFVWTPEGRRLYDYTSGVLVSNLGHNPTAWLRRVQSLLGWDADDAGEFSPAVPLTAYNAVTPTEVDASEQLLRCLSRSAGSTRLEQVIWAASGSEAVHKAIWAALHFRKDRSVILATRNGFHGKKGLSHAVTGCETDPERDPRVRFVGFPSDHCRDVSMRGAAFDPAPFVAELQRQWDATGGRVGAFISEPYLGGGGSFHPPAAYFPAVQKWCRERDVLFIWDEVQSNFGRTAKLFAFEQYGVEPDLVVLGKGLGNGVPVAAVVGRRDVFATLSYGDTSDTWSGNPLSCAAVVATLEAFEARDYLAETRVTSPVIEESLVALKRFPFVAAVRGEAGGMVWGVEFGDHDGRTGPQWANDFVLANYLGHGGDGVHLLGPLAKKVVRVSPPLVLTPEQARDAAKLMHAAAGRVAEGAVRAEGPR